MNVIRINWPLIRKLSLALFFTYFIYVIIRFAISKYEQTLKYDHVKREFYVKRQWAELNVNTYKNVK